MEPQRATLGDLTHVAILINIQLQNGDHGITFKDVYDGLDSGQLWKSLENRVPGFEALRTAAERIRGEEDNNIGVTGDHGLALLLALVLVATQKRLWMEPLPPTHAGQGFPPSN